jgi:ubiquinone biosynthesis protein
LGAEAALADRIVRDVRTLANLPELVRRIEARYPPPGAAPPPPPLPDIVLVEPRHYGRYLLISAISGIAGAALALLVA